MDGVRNVFVVAIVACIKATAVKRPEARVFETMKSRVACQPKRAHETVMT